MYLSIGWSRLMKCDRDICKIYFACQKCLQNLAIKFSGNLVDFSKCDPYLISNLFNIPSLATDVENNLLHQVNFKYFSVHDFHSSREISQAFSQDNSLALFHANLRSLSANYNDLISLLADLKHNFNIIGISETRILMGKNPVVNINIPGYWSFTFSTNTAYCRWCWILHS